MSMDERIKALEARVEEHQRRVWVMSDALLRIVEQCSHVRWEQINPDDPSLYQFSMAFDAQAVSGPELSEASIDLVARAFGEYVQKQVHKFAKRMREEAA